MEHKAYIFDYENFNKELAFTLFQALSLKKVTELRKFIVDNLSFIKTPWEGEVVESDWEDLIELKDEHNYGDFALTKYYDPNSDNGLCDVWLDLPDTLTKRQDLFLGKQITTLIPENMDRTLSKIQTWILLLIPFLKYYRKIQLPIMPKIFRVFINF